MDVEAAISDVQLVVICVSSDREFGSAVRRALRDIFPAQLSAAQEEAAPASPRDYREVVARARRWLERNRPEGTSVELLIVEKLANLAAAVSDRRQVALLLVDAADQQLKVDPFDTGLREQLDAAISSLPANVMADLSTAGVYVYEPPSDRSFQPTGPYTLRTMPLDEWILKADVVCAVTDLVDLRFVRPTPLIDKDAEDTTLARSLADFLTARAGQTWALFSYTGSLVSGLIADLERLAIARGNPIFRGPSEHSLASGAMARWILGENPFVIVVTSAMIDEFKGTLANLRQANARGFIICADSASDRWWPFQGTIHRGDDARESILARGMAFRYLERASSLDGDLHQAFEAYDADCGPVLLLATQSVLEARGGGVSAMPAPPRRVSILTPSETVDAVIHMLNNEPVRLLWQVGSLNDEEDDLLHNVAARVGAALADSPIRPGTVSMFRHGRVNPNYLGMLGIYSCSPRVMNYLHNSDGRLRSANEQCLFFLKSRISDASTPFNERALSSRIRVAQVTNQPAHLAPFTDYPICSDLAPFLRHVLTNLDVDPEVLRTRREAIKNAISAPGPLELIPAEPMTLNYFYHEVNEVIKGLAPLGYKYTGVYEAGRGGISAMRNVAQTGPGFSGWYGRALMGDAWSALPTIALSRRGNVIAFVGDGAAALVPDPVPSLLQQVSVEGRPFEGNVSVFKLLNGGHSIIRTYREMRFRETALEQTTVLNAIDADWCREIGNLTVNHRQMRRIDRRELGNELISPATINLYSVLLSHNNAGDGLSALDMQSWHSASQ